MAKPHLDKTITALAGEFLVAGQLCLRGYVASLTLKNYPGVDIFCFDPKTQQQVTVQVKTKRGGDLYYVPEDVDHWVNPFVFVYIASDEDVRYYIVPARDVARMSAKQRTHYLETHPNVKKDQPRMISVKALEPFRNRWDLLWSAG